ncbi:HAMP domain-containing protein [Cohnella endophytica]|uniref:histidine kinase n=1 Tax=Cohnella endophytica TaxID=2419778 RepID=A0A494Y3D9_9BACL|nr:ATP-binding protein [Cohnella endophytica]RKP55011.1 HAMP domain-containing protein [Cohnella endophytica]
MGIQQRLVGSYLAVIAITVAILEIFLIFSVKSYYYRNVERALVSQAELSASFFHQYFSAEDLEKQTERLLKGFSQHSAAQVQIISRSGQLLQDSTGMRGSPMMTDYPDVQEARNGDVGIWQGREPSTDESVLAVSYPLQSVDGNAGVVRYVTSLTETKKTVDRISEILITVGIIVVAIVTVVGVLLSRTITSSVSELKFAARKMSEGDFSARAKKRYRDELGTLADTLNAMATKIQRDEALKNDFISSVSHELRTPLTSIKGWAVTLYSNRGEDRTLLEDGLRIIETETDRLTRMVDELLDFSKWDNGQIELYRVSLDLSDFLRNIGKQLAPRAARLNITLEVDVSDTIPSVQVDENRLKQVMINLIDNALKFTSDNGSVKIFARQVEGGVRIIVEDTGAGIASQDIDHVFQKFYKGNGSTHGSGLGLSISDQIIKQHGGTLTLESRIGVGTKAIIHLPV